MRIRRTDMPSVGNSLVADHSIFCLPLNALNSSNYKRFFFHSIQGPRASLGRIYQTKKCSLYMRKITVDPRF